MLIAARSAAAWRSAAAASNRVSKAVRRASGAAIAAPLHHSADHAQDDRRERDFLKTIDRAPVPPERLPLVELDACARTAARLIAEHQAQEVFLDCLEIVFAAAGIERAWLRWPPFPLPAAAAAAPASSTDPWAAVEQVVSEFR
jgi:hypothetical protein